MTAIPEISERTKTLYKTTYEGLVKKYPGLNLKDPKAVVAQLRADGRKETTIRSALASLIHQHKSAGEKDLLLAFRKEYKDLTVGVTKKAVEQTTEGKEHKTLPWTEVLSTAEKIQMDPSISEVAKILVALYTELIPVRNDYVKLRIVARKPRKYEGNYILLNKSQGLIQINEHKTSKEYGPITQTLTSGLKTRIQNYLAENPGLDCLFDYDDSYITHMLGNAFEKHSGQRVTVNTLRHSYITEFRKGDKALDEKSALAKKMGHSLWLQELYREVRS